MIAASEPEPQERRRPAYVPVCPECEGVLMTPYKSLPRVTYYHCPKCGRNGKAPRVSFDRDTNSGNHT